MNQLQRVQVYLDPKDLSVMDMVAKAIKIKRSQIIRDLMRSAASVAHRYIETYNIVEPKRHFKDRLKIWKGLFAIGQSKTGDLGLRIDEIYNKDEARNDKSLR